MHTPSSYEPSKTDVAAKTAGAILLATLIGGPVAGAAVALGAAAIYHGTKAVVDRDIAEIERKKSS